MPMDRIMEQSSVDSDLWADTSDETLADTGFYWRELGGVKVLVCQPLEKKGFTNGFSTRLGGVSPFPENALNLAGFDEDTQNNIFENRRRFLNVFDGRYDLATAWQVHGEGIKIVKTHRDVSNSHKKFDALISNLDKILVGVKTADCVPILLGDVTNKAFAAVHAGWRGAAQSIVRKSVEKMSETYGSDPKNLICAIGPAAGCEKYEVGRDVISAFEKSFFTSGKYFTATHEGHALIDLHLVNKDQLIGSGVPEKRIFIAPFCTIMRTDLFFSYRIERKRYGKTGRLLSVIGRS